MVAESIPIGDARIWDIALTTDTGADFDLAGCTVQVTCRKAIDTSAATSGPILFRHTITIDASGAVTGVPVGLAIGGNRPNGVAATLAREGVLTETLTSTESRALTAGDVVYDVRIKLPNGNERTPIIAAPLTFVGHASLEAVV